ncbi:MAG: DUF4838 domain-containing protein [Clostridiales bacterium]|nr:DUF4838 domain-containing protein [Clostridiales bacterium]
MNRATAFGRKFLGLMLAIAMILSMQTAAVAAAPTQDIDVSFSAACSFEKDLNLVYNCKINTPGDFTNIRLRVSFQTFSDNTGNYTWKNTDITDYTYDASTGKYKFVFKGICSDQMSNIVKCTLCANIGNQAYASQTKEFSIKQYAEKILEIYGPNTDEESKSLCTLMVDMLNYGAAAQKYFDRNKHNLANSGLTDAQKALATQLPDQLNSVQNVQALTGSTAKFKSAALSLLNTVDFIVYCAFTNAPGANVVAELSYPTVEGGTAVVKKYLKDCEYEADKDRYRVVFDAIPSLYFKTPFTIVIKDNGKQISPTLTYSYESYVKSIVEGDFSDEMKELAKCMLAYGESANAYFAAVSGSGSSSGGGDVDLPIDPGFANISTYKNSTYTQDLPKSVIVIPVNSTAEEQYAAGLLQTFIQKEDGYQPQIITDATAQGSQGFEISVGLTNRPHGDLLYTEEDSYKIKSYTNGIALFGNGNRGTIDAAMKFLSICGGYFWLSFEDGYKTNQSHFKYETNIDIDHKRAFTFTDIDVLFGKTHEGNNRLFSLANGLNGFYVNCTVKNQPGGDNWYLSKAAPKAYGDLQPGQAHTLMAEYVTADNFAEHPEWFSWIIEKQKDGTIVRERRPEQLCLSNPEVYELIKKHVFEILESDAYDPTAPMQIISLSQADNQYYCMCDDCYTFRKQHERADDQEGLCDAAFYLDLCNKISAEVKAKGYTNVYIDMLAYTYNLKPPVNMTMDDHVIVRYAAISRCYAHDCDDTKCLRNGEVIKHLQGWANLANTYGGQLWIWDYNANFRDTTGPYMNLDMLCHDIKYYRDIGVSGIYLQSNDAHNRTNTEFGDLRLYLGAVLLENPDADTKKETMFFLNEFYGDSAPYIYEAIKLMEEQAKNHAAGSDADPYPYYYRGYCMTYDCTTSQVFANLYPNNMHANNKMPEDQIELCEAYWNKALEVAANDTQRHLFVTGRTHLCWRWAKSCMGVLEFNDPATYRDMNLQLHTDVFKTYKTQFYSLIIRSVPGTFYIENTPDRWCNTKPWGSNSKYTNWQEEWDNRGN